MKRYQRILGLLLAGLLCLSLVGCGGDSSGETASGKDGSQAGAAGQFLIAGTPLSEFTLARSVDSGDDIKALAKELHAFLETAFGVNLKNNQKASIPNTKASGHELILGVTTAADAPDISPECPGVICEKDGCLYVTAATAGMLRGMLTDFFKEQCGLDFAAPAAATKSVEIKKDFRAEYEYEKKDVSSVNQMTKLTGRENFVFGVTGHCRSYPSYPVTQLEEQIRLAASLGSKVYRFNFNPKKEENYLYLDSVLTLCEAYGMEMMLVLDELKGLTPNDLKNYHTAIAKRFKGRIAYYQVYNETDVYCLKNDDGSLYKNPAPDGRSLTDYNPAHVKECVEKMKLSCEAIHAADPAAKLVINFSDWHIGLLEEYVKQGVKFDIVGIDWYSNSDRSKLEEKMLPLLESTFPRHKFMICECNLWMNDKEHTEEEQAAWLEDFTVRLYKNTDSRFLGIIYYELLDEPHIAASSDKYNGEAFFGLVHNDENGVPGQVKLGYKKLQELIGGHDVELTVRRKGV